MIGGREAGNVFRYDPEGQEWEELEELEVKKHSLRAL